MIELIGLVLALVGIVIVGLVNSTMRRDFERRHRELEQNLKDDGGIN